MPDRNFLQFSSRIALGVVCALTQTSLSALERMDGGAAEPAGAYAGAPVTTPAPTDRIIVRFRDRGMQRMSAVQKVDRIERLSLSRAVPLSFVRSTANDNQVLQLDGRKPLSDVEAIAAELEQDPDVLYAEPDAIMRPLFVPGDPRYNEQWHYYEEAAGINLPEASDRTNGEGVVVAVIDTGIRPHPDLEQQILPGYDFISHVDRANDGDARDADATDPGDWELAGECGEGMPALESSWHGTHVAGTIAAASDNGIGVSGVAWGARILPVRVLGKCGGYVSDIADGMMWAAGLRVEDAPENPYPARILNLSLGGEGECSRHYQEAIQKIRDFDVTVVVAAGNEDHDARHTRPANCEGVVTVASVKRDGGRAYYSNWGSTIDVAAPGGEIYDPARSTYTTIDGILSTLNSGTESPGSDDHYAFYQGTSMAAPHVSGVAALLYALDAEITPDRVESILKDSARAFPTVTERPCDTDRCGAGIVDAAAAVARIDVEFDTGSQGAQAREDMIEFSERDGRFGSPIAGGFGTDLEWDEEWELRWMDFTFSGGRTVRLFHVTAGFDSSVRYIGFYDPDDGGAWTGLEPVR